MKNTINDLRNHLFAQIEKITDAENEEQRKKALEEGHVLGELAKVIVDSAKVEVAYLKKLGKNAGSKFIPSEDIKEIGA